MSPQLAHELKDAGFPGIRIGEHFDHRVGSHSDDYGGASDAPCDCLQDRIPTLQELVAECGTAISDFDLRNNYVGGKSGMLWIATLLQRDNGEKLFQGQASTPTEAVARLWLAINASK
jgi:hypothetical protein